MAARNRTRKSLAPSLIQDDGPPATATSPALDPDQVDPPAPPRDPARELGDEEIRTLAFFDVLRLLTQAQWDRRVVYVYRQEPAIEKANPKDCKYIGKVPHAFDEEYLKEHFGGGKFLLVLNNLDMPQSQRGERSTSVWIEGEPIIDPRRFVEKNPAPRPSEAPAGQGNGQIDVAAIVNSVVAALKQQERPDAGKAVEEAVAMMRIASTAAIETAKGAAGTITGNPLVEKVLERFLTQKPESGLDQILAMLKIQEAMKALSGAATPAPAAAADPLGAVGGTLKVLGLDIGDLVKEALTGRNAGKDWQTVIGEIGTQLVTNGPAMLEKVRELKTIELEIARAQAQRPQLVAPAAYAQPPAAGPLPVARPVASARQPNATADSPLPANFAPVEKVVPITAGRPEPLQPIIEPPEQVQMTISFQTINQICELIASSFEEGVPGDITGRLLRSTFPREADFFAQSLLNGSTEDERLAQVKQFAAQHPILSEIVEDPEFDSFAVVLLRALAAPASGPGPAAA